MKAQEKWEDQHLQTHQATPIVQKLLREATKTTHRVIKTQRATGELVNRQLNAR